MNRRVCIALVAVLGAAPMQDVDVGGHELNVHVVGKAGPTVVLESGLGDGWAIWKDVQAAVAESNRVIAYDRAGLGRSEPGPLPRSPIQIAMELHALLEAIDAPPPYVLVGHSAGGLHVRTFAALYPDEVGALVLVEATPEQLLVRLREQFAERLQLEREQTDALYEPTPAGVRAEWEAIKTIVDTGRLPGVEGLPQVPTVILTATRIDPTSQFIVESAEGKQVWLALHAEWARQNDKAVHISTDRAGHYLHVEQPALVIAAIQEACRVVGVGGELSAQTLQAVVAPPDR